MAGTICDLKASNLGYQLQRAIWLKVTDAKSLMADKIARRSRVQIETLRTMIIRIQMLEINADEPFSRKRLQSLINKPGVMGATMDLKTIGSRNLGHSGYGPKFEDEEVALKLALTGAIKDQLLPMDEVISLYAYFKEHYP